MAHSGCQFHFIAWALRGCRLLVLATLTGFGGNVGQADPARLCEEAARRAADRTGVPYRVLMAVSLTETGRARGGRARPWPWTVNMEGTGRWFGDPASARAYVERHHAAGARSYDIGCFQINYKWHGHAFTSLEEMFTPDRNADYAARFLARLYGETQDWSKAAGTYHSRTPAHAKRYRKTFDAHYAALVAAPAPPTLTQVPGQGNSYPLLQPGGTVAGHGSLFPATAGRAPLVALGEGG